VKYLTKQEQIVLCLTIALVLTGWAVKVYRTAHPPRRRFGSRNPDMRPANLEDDIRKIVAADPRYPYEAYVFVQEALKHTQRALGRTNRPKARRRQGIAGGHPLFALKTFGPMVPTMLEEWGIHSCEDFGEIVFNMIEHKVASKTIPTAG
jgi:uncharacterized repeat protein (TIGR04138 family)